jgi:hypothetical protein
MREKGPAETKSHRKEICGGKKKRGDGDRYSFSGSTGAEMSEEKSEG